MKQLQQKIQQQINKMAASGKLFRSKLVGSEIWNMYLASFEDGTDPLFAREDLERCVM